MRRKRCEHCGTMASMRTTQRYCGRSCAWGANRAARMKVLRSGRVRYSAHKLGEATRALAERWGLSPECVSDMVAWGKQRWRTGFKAGEGRGYRRGWAEALGERE